MSTNGPIKTVNEGLVVCLDAGNMRSYVGSGTTWSDLTKNGDAVMVNTPTYSDKSFSFSGATGTYFSLTGNSAFKSLTGDVTLCGWCRQDNRDYSRKFFNHRIYTNISNTMITRYRESDLLFT